MLNSRRVVLVGWLLLGGAPSARAEGTAPSAPPAPISRTALHSVDEALHLQQMERALALVDRDAARLSLYLATANLGVAAANFVGGAFAAQRGAVGSSIGPFVGGGFAAASGILGLTIGRAPFRRVHETFLKHQTSMEADALIAQTERAWYSHAESERQFRALFGTALTSVGGGMVLFSTVNLIANLALPGKSANNSGRAAFGGVLLGLSGFLLVNGVTMLVSPGPIEAGWRSYSALRMERGEPRTSFHLTPIRQGAAIGMALRF